MPWVNIWAAVVLYNSKQNLMSLSQALCYRVESRHPPNLWLPRDGFLWLICSLKHFIWPFLEGCNFTDTSKQHLIENLFHSVTWRGTAVEAAWPGRRGSALASGTGWRATLIEGACASTGPRSLSLHHRAPRPPPPLSRTWSWCCAPPTPPPKSSVLRETCRVSTCSCTGT